MAVSDQVVELEEKVHKLENASVPKELLLDTLIDDINGVLSWKDNPVLVQDRRNDWGINLIS